MITVSLTYACDFTGCTFGQSAENAAAAESAGWTYAGSAYGVASMPPPASLRCPTHRAQ